MLRPIPHNSVDVIPQAIIDLPIEEVVGRTAEVVEDMDDLDSFRGASYRLNDQVEIAVRQYRGFPPGKVSIYIDREISDVGTITAMIRTILADLKIPAKALSWERRDDPNL